MRKKVISDSVFACLFMFAAFQLTKGITRDDFGLTCFQQNYEYLLCTWDAQQTGNTSRCSLEYKGGERYEDVPRAVCQTSNETYSQCHVFEMSTKMACKIDTCISYKSYTVRMKPGCEIAGSVYEVAIPIDDSNVKLKSISQSEIRWRTSSRMLNLTWWLPTTPCGVFDDSGGITCDVNIRSKSEDISRQEVTLWKKDCRQNSMCDRCDSMHLTSTDLHPSTVYNVTLRCKVTGSSIWSDTTSIQIKTKLEVPNRGPDVEPGAFLQYIDQGKSYLVVYWKSISVSDSNGELSGYNVSTSWTSVVTNEETAKFEIDSELKQSYRLTIWSYNSMGYSINATSLNVRLSKVPKTRYVVADYQGNSTFNISWLSEDVASIVSVVYYWCVGTKEKINSVIVVTCKSNSKWFIDDKVNKQWHRFQISKSLLNKELYFAVSLSTTGQTSGLVWELCRKSVLNNKIFCPHQEHKSHPAREENHHIVVITVTSSLVFTIIIIVSLIIRYVRKINRYIPKIEVPGNISSTYNDYVHSKGDLTGSSAIPYTDQQGPATK